jgi:hypothetical protein
MARGVGASTSRPPGRCTKRASSGPLSIVLLATIAVAPLLVDRVRLMVS